MIGNETALCSDSHNIMPVLFPGRRVQMKTAKIRASTYVRR